MTSHANETHVYHWTPAKQQAFLSHLASNGSVRQAACHVSMSTRAAYDLRYRQEGMAFRMGWAAAILIARDALEDDMMERAMHGSVDEYTRSAPDADGTVHIKRTRFDNRLGSATLARLDRMRTESCENADERMLSQTIANDWGAYLDLVGTSCADGADNNARVSRYILARMHRNNPFAAIWTDAEFECEVTQITEGLEDKKMEEVRIESPPFSVEQEAADMHVWYCTNRNEWRTNFPPPTAFDGEEEDAFGESGYERALSVDEAALHQQQNDAVNAPLRSAGEAARRAWFGIAA
jgi:hypothetical protein